jgi:hypothetical protein
LICRPAIISSLSFSTGITVVVKVDDDDGIVVGAIQWARSAIHIAAVVAFCAVRHGSWCGCQRSNRGANDEACRVCRIDNPRDESQHVGANAASGRRR